MLYITFNTNEEKIRFNYLYNKYNKLLYKYAYGILHNFHDTEDVLQISWLKISKNISNTNNLNESITVNYLITILKNTAYDFYNRNKNFYNITSLDENWNSEEYYSQDCIYESAKLLYFKEALTILEDKYRLPLLFKYTYGFSTKEIAKQLNISESNVSVRINRAKTVIKKYVENKVKNEYE